MKKFKQLKKIGAFVVVAAVSAPSFAEGSSIDAYFTAIDLSSVGTAVAGLGVVIVGIAMSVKGIGLAKRVISKA